MTWKEKLQSQVEHSNGDHEREVVILQMLARGCSNRQIAEATHYSPQSIKRRVAVICIKLKAANRTQAAAIAVQKGLVHVD